MAQLGTMAVAFGAGLLVGIGLMAALPSTDITPVPAPSVAGASVSPVSAAQPSCPPCEGEERPPADLQTACQETCEVERVLLGCVTPPTFPDDLAHEYTPAGMLTWFDDLTKRCPEFAQSAVHIDCDSFPCMVFLEVEAGTTHEEADVFCGDERLKMNTGLHIEDKDDAWLVGLGIEPDADRPDVTPMFERMQGFLQSRPKEDEDED